MGVVKKLFKEEIKISYWGLSGKESAYNAGAVGDMGSIPDSERFPGKMLQYSFFFFFNFTILYWFPMDGEASWATVHRVTKSQTWLKWLSMHAKISFSQILLENSQSTISFSAGESCGWIHTLASKLSIPLNEIKNTNVKIQVSNQESEDTTFSANTQTKVTKISRHKTRRITQNSINFGRQVKSILMIDWLPFYKTLTRAVLM